LDDLKDRRGYSHSKEEALDRTMWRADFGRGFGPVVRQTAKWISYQWYLIYKRRYSVIKKDGFNFVLLYFPNYIWYMNYLHNILKRRS